MDEKSEKSEPKKGGLGLLIGLAPKKPSEDSMVPPASDDSEASSEAEEMAAKGMMSALKADDTAGFVDALKTFLSARGL